MDLPEAVSGVFARFQRKFITRDGCWVWTAATANGYGVMKIGGRMVQAHRLAYLLFHGEDPGSHCVCHHCDVKRCVQPHHLFLGSHSENMADAYSKGRMSHLGGDSVPEWVGSEIYNPELMNQLDADSPNFQPRSGWFPITSQEEAIPA